MSRIVRKPVFRVSGQFQSIGCTHYDNTSMQYTAIIHSCKNDNFQMKKCVSFLKTMFQSKNKKIMYTPVNPNFTIQTWGVRGSTLHGHVSLMSNRIWLEGINFGFKKSCCQNKGVDQLYGNRTADQCLCFSICKSMASFDAAHIFNFGCITGVHFLLLNFVLKHRIVGTHIPNNPLLLSELLVFELN